MQEKPQSIDQVINELDSIIDQTLHDNNYLGIFSYVYRRTTEQIRQAIVDKQFDDNARMEKMDVNFANKFLTAYQKFNNNETCSKSWSVPFKAKDEKLTIIQHLLMGMNAHINLDLGIAASEIAPGDAIHDVEKDFMKVNEILAGLTEEMEIKIGRISWWMFLLGWMGGKTDDAIVNFSIRKARDEAWEFACKLSSMDDAQKILKIEEVDTIISELAGIIRHPPGIILRNILRFISRFEENQVKKIIEGLEKQ
jgi:hypothetical protein